MENFIFCAVQLKWIFGTYIRKSNSWYKFTFLLSMTDSVVIVIRTLIGYEITQIQSIQRECCAGDYELTIPR